MDGRPAVPFYPNPHIFGSKVWNDKNFHIVQPALGEVLSTRTRWDTGASPILPPLPITAGDPQCVENGEPLAQGLTQDDVGRFESWPIECFIPNPLDDWGWAADVYRCEVQRYWADRIVEWDEGDEGQCTAMLRLKFPGANIRFWPGQRFLPPTITIVHPSYGICVYAATQSGEQALVEVIEGVTPPVNRGQFSTQILWYSQAQRGLLRLSDEGLGDTQPLLFVGHSYGGASAIVSAAICRMTQRNRLIRWLTFGAPRPGDFRLRGLAGLPTRGCALANHDDPITAIPPNLASLLPAQVVLGRNLLPFAQWEAPDETWRQLANGTIIKNAPTELSTGELVTLLRHVWTTGSFFAYPPHQITEYARRLALRCPRAIAVADGNLGLRHPVFPAVGLFGLNVPNARLALQAPEVAAGRLGITKANLTSAGLGLYGSKLAKGVLGITSYELAANALGVRPAGAVASGGLGIGPPNLLRSGFLGLGFTPRFGGLGLNTGFPPPTCLQVGQGSGTGPALISVSGVRPGTLLVFWLQAPGDLTNLPTLTYTDTSGTRPMVMFRAISGPNGSEGSFWQIDVLDNTGTINATFGVMPSQYLFHAYNFGSEWNGVVANNDGSFGTTNPCGAVTGYSMPTARSLNFQWAFDYPGDNGLTWTTNWQSIDFFAPFISPWAGQEIVSHVGFWIASAPWSGSVVAGTLLTGGGPWPQPPGIGNWTQFVASFAPP